MRWRPAVAENVAREDLNAIDEAHALAALLEEFGLTQEELGRRVGRSQEWISNSNRLLNLPDQILVLLERGEITRAHGRALLTEPGRQERIALGRRAATERWTVRRLQAEIDSDPPSAPARAGLPADALDAADRWTEALRTRGHAMTVRATARGFQIEGRSARRARAADRSRRLPRGPRRVGEHRQVCRCRRAAPCAPHYRWYYPNH